MSITEIIQTEMMRDSSTNPSLKLRHFASAKSHGTLLTALAAIATITLGTLVCSCGPPASMQMLGLNANKLYRGMSAADFLAATSTKPEQSFSVTVPSTAKTYDAHIYHQWFNGIQHVFMAVYLDNKLVYWGFPYEFARHPDATINEVGRLVLQKYESLDK